VTAPFVNPLNGVLHQCGLANAAASDWLGTVGVGFASAAVLNPPSATMGAGIHVLANATMSDFVHSVEGTGKGLTVFRIVPNTLTTYGCAVCVQDRFVLVDFKGTGEGE